MYKKINYSSLPMKIKKPTVKPWFEKKKIKIFSVILIHQKVTTSNMPCTF